MKTCQRWLRVSVGSPRLEIPLGRDRLEWSTNLSRSIRFHVERIELTWSTQVEDHDA